MECAIGTMPPWTRARARKSRTMPCSRSVCASMTVWNCLTVSASSWSLRWSRVVMKPRKHAIGVFSLCAATPNRSRPSSSSPRSDGPRRRCVIWSIPPPVPKTADTPQSRHRSPSHSLHGYVEMSKLLRDYVGLARLARISRKIGRDEHRREGRPEAASLRLAGHRPRAVGLHRQAPKAYPRRPLCRDPRPDRCRLVDPGRARHGPQLMDMPAGRRRQALQQQHALTAPGRGDDRAPATTPGRRDQGHDLRLAAVQQPIDGLALTPAPLLDRELVAQRHVPERQAEHCGDCEEGGPEAHRRRRDPPAEHRSLAAAADPAQPPPDRPAERPGRRCRRQRPCQLAERQLQLAQGAPACGAAVKVVAEGVLVVGFERAERVPGGQLLKLRVAHRWDHPLDSCASTPASARFSSRSPPVICARTVSSWASTRTATSRWVYPPR